MIQLLSNKIRKILRRLTQKNASEVFPDEIFLDSRNLPEFNTHQFEGRIERPLLPATFVGLGIVFSIIILLFTFRLWRLQIKDGQIYAGRSEANRLDRTTLFSDRGVIYDRNQIPLAWNEINPANSDFSLRAYSLLSGLSSITGFVKYPSKDTSGFYYQEDYIGKAGIEKAFDSDLTGIHGTRLIEVDVHNNIQSESVLNQPKAGRNITLSIDARIQHELYTLISDLSEKVGFTGGAGVLMNVKTGEVIAKVNYPEYSSDVMTQGKDSALIKNYLQDKSNPFLDRAVDGLYTPGSTVKPFIAVSALAENLISPNKKIVSTGALSLPNPYVPGAFTVFKDWKAHGWVDMRDALAVSSDVYFYVVGGGFEDQKGLGITRIDSYMKLFGFGQPISNPFFAGSGGTIPTPTWKAEHFNGEAWTLGDTYHTAIGQYGFQVSPMQMVRALSGIALGGIIHEPTIIKDEKTPTTLIPLDPTYFDIVRQGMRQGVTDGISSALNVPYVSVASKTGTAELGSLKQQVNSWDTGFFPYENPQYAFVVIMERGPSTNTTGALYIMRQLLDWMSLNTPEYFK